ncbi:GNAT family N-acetyltransferase [Agrobacterium larrymoorei]|nr:GNAT family N-acetyltransferase [Agrobacterium larrymoorei]
MTDAQRLARITNDTLVTRNLLRTSTPFTLAEARRSILRIRRKNLPVWAIDNGQIIGLIGLAGEFGFWLARSAWGKGYATEASRMVIDHAFSTLDISTLHANPIATNSASRHLLKKSGFREIGRSQAFCKQRNAIVPLIRYRLDRPHWASS